jgi:hypothetical protein
VIGARHCLVFGLALGAFSVAREARAEYPSQTLGIEPSFGGGVAGFTHAGALPGFIGYTTLGVELRAEFDAWGGFLRGEFYSSGEGGRWTAPAMMVGVTRRIYGDGITELGFTTHAGITYARWHGSNGGCPITLVFPSSCAEEPPPAASGGSANTVAIGTATVDDTIDTLGLDVGARFEFPIHPIYLALDGDLSLAAPLESGPPGAVFQARVALVLAFRDVRSQAGGGSAPNEDQRTFRHF